jgi:hypothetical protein
MKEFEIDVIWNEEKEVFEVLNSDLMEEGVKYDYFCDVSNESFVFEKKDGVVDYNVG